jgi:hypothetical protein
VSAAWLKVVVRHIVTEFTEKKVVCETTIKWHKQKLEETLYQVKTTIITPDKHYL